MRKANGELTSMQKAFLEEQLKVRFADGKGAECARKAGYAPKCASNAASVLRRNPVIQTAMQKALNDEGLTLPVIAKETKRLALHSQHPFAPDMPDNEVRRRTIEMTGKMYDVFPSHKIDIRKTEARYDMTPQDIKRFDDYKADEILDAEIIEEDGIESF